MKINVQVVDGKLIPSDKESMESIKEFESNAIYQIDIKNLDKRTIAQNRLIHQFCLNVANELHKQNIVLNDAIKHDTPVSMMAVKEFMFKSVVRSLYGKESTTKLNRDEIDLVFDYVLRALGNKGIDTLNILRG